MKTKKNKYVILLFIFLLNINYAYSQGWLWANMIGGIFEDNGNSGVIASDDIYVYGTFQSPDCYLKTDTFQIRGGEDIFLVKYDGIGNEIWARRLGGFDPGINHEQITQAVLDPLGKYIYVTGRFRDSITIGLTTLRGSSEEIFILKLDTSGNSIWSKSAGSNIDDGGTGIVIDSSGNIYLSAFCFGQALFDTYVVQPGTILAKYDTSGNCLWAKNIMRNVSCAILLENDFLYFAGTSLYNVDTVYIDTTKIVSNGSLDIYLSKFDTSGRMVWAHKEGWTSSDYVSGYSIDHNSNLYIAGGFVDSTIIGEDTIFDSGEFLFGYDSLGNFKWMNQFNASSHHIFSQSMVTDPQGNIYITGEFLDTAFFDNYIIFSGGFDNAFLACYSSNGNCIGVNNIPGHGRGVAIDNSNRPIISGNFVQATTTAGTVFSHGGLDAGVIMHDRIIGIEEVERKSPNELFIYSNPTTGKCNINMPEEFLNKNGTLTLTLYDSNGKSIHSYPVNVKDGTIKLNLEYEASGIYIVTLTDGRKVYRGKIVFE